MKCIIELKKKMKFQKFDLMLQIEVLMKWVGKHILQH